MGSSSWENKDKGSEWGGKAKNWERKEEKNEWTDKGGNWERKEDSKKWDSNGWDQKHGDASWKEGGSSSSGSWKDGRKEKKESSKPFLPGDWLCRAVTITTTRRMTNADS